MRYPKLEIAALTDNTLFHLWIEKGEKKELKLVIFRTRYAICFPPSIYICQTAHQKPERGDLTLAALGTVSKCPLD